MARYLLVVNFQPGVVETPMEEWKPEEVDGAPRLLPALCTRSSSTAASCVESEVLAGPDLAKIVTSDGATAPVVTDGPFQEFKEWVAGYQIVDVESEERAIEIAGEALGRAGAGRRRDRAADPGAPGHGGAPSNAAEMEATSRRPRASQLSPDPVEDLLRELAPQVLGALARRYGDFDAAEDAVQEALLAAADALAARRHPGEPTRLADPDRRAAADRPVAERAVARDRARASSRRSREVDRREVSDEDDTLIAAVHVLPSRR